MKTKDSIVSLTSDVPDKSMAIIDGSIDPEILKKSTSQLRRKAALLIGRKRSADKVRQFK